MQGPWLLCSPQQAPQHYKQQPSSLLGKSIQPPLHYLKVAPLLLCSFLPCPGMSARSNTCIALCWPGGPQGLWHRA